MAYASIVKHPGRNHRRSNIKPQQQMWANLLPKQRPDGSVRTGLAINLSAAVIQQAGLQLGDRVDILLDRADRSGIIRKDPNGLTLSLRGSQRRKQRDGHLRLSDCDWISTQRSIPLEVISVQDGELLFEVPPSVTFKEELVVPGRTLMVVLGGELSADRSAELLVPDDPHIDHWRD